MSEIKHFEDLWNYSESVFEDTVKTSSSEAIFQELLLKVNLYRSVNEQNPIQSDKQKIKSAIFGEILTTLTKLSKKDNNETSLKKNKRT